MSTLRNRPLGLIYRDKEKAFPGYTLFSPVRGRHADLVDGEGLIVHQWHHPQGIQHVKWLPNGNLLVHALPPDDAEGAENIGGSAAALFELDKDSNVVWEYRDVYMHHDFHRLDNGNTLIIRWEKLPTDVSERVQGGWIADTDSDWMWGDMVREITPAGDVVRDWCSWEHLATDHHVKCPLESRKEWTHMNSLELMPDGNWLVSFRLTSTIAIVDGTTGDLRWRWGRDKLSHQHHATLVDENRILVFDNGCHRKEMPSFSQVVEVDRTTNKVVWSWTAPTILDVFSFMVSGCERLPNGNTLITEGASGHLFEVTHDGEVVWEFVSPWVLPSKFGPTPVVFRSYRIAEDDARLSGLDLSPTPYESLNDRVSVNEVLGADDEMPGEPST